MIALSIANAWILCSRLGSTGSELLGQIPFQLQTRQGRLK